ncbi:hypothetical protein LguiB_002184 [Lonicera macranthoides]
MSTGYLPVELLSNILTRLPVRMLLRFTIVSKSWYSLITSPNFITTHQLNNNRTTVSNNNRTPLLLMVRHCTQLNQYLCKEHYSVRRDNDTFDEFAKFDFPFISQCSHFNLVGSCNGLVCLFDDHGTRTFIVLWNPSLRKSVTLPQPRAVTKSRGHFGFGIDPVTGDYKIVGLAYPYTDRFLEVELFNLSTGSWRSINVGDFSYVTSPHTQQAFLNGVVHWSGYSSYKVGGSMHNLIVSFDMRNESLGVVVVPPCVQQYWDHIAMRVTIFRECLSFLHPDGDHSWCLWVMKEYGVESSWTKQFTVDVQLGLGRPTCFRGNGDLLVERRDWSCREVELVSYSPKSKLIKHLEIHGTRCSFYVDTYKESLVLVKGLNEVLGRKETSAGAVTCQGTSVMPREDDEVNGKRKKMKLN